MKPIAWVSLGLVAIISVQVTNAFLNPPCSTIPVTPGCTNTPSQVTLTLPACPIPFEQWATEARSMPGNSPRPNGVIPPWFNKALALRGQQVTSEYRFPWYIVMFFGLLIEINMPDIRNPLMFNKKNTNGPDNAKRDMATIMQGLIWTKEYFYRMPVDGYSSFITSIKNVRATHIDVQTRGYTKIANEGCLVTPPEYENEVTNDVLWNAFLWDLGNSSIPLSQRTPSPTNWLTCPPTTNCSACTACSNCVPVYNFPTCTGVNNVNCTVTNMTCIDAGGNACNSTIDPEGCTNCTKEYNLPAPDCIQANENCTIIQTNCTNCSSCASGSCVSNAVPSCKYMQPLTYHCDTCICDANSTNCGACETCTNTTSCLDFWPPLYNQQGMMLVIYNLVAYPVMFSSDLAINACDADQWAFNHLWASIGYGLGIDDKYNVMLQPNIQAARVYYSKIYNQIIIPGLFNFDKQTRLMMDNVFKGLSTATAGLFSPAFLLHRFAFNFLNIDAPHLRALMSAQEILTDQAFDFAYIPQFMSSPIYRGLLNTAINDFSYFASAILMPGNCTTYTKISQKCFV